MSHPHGFPAALVRIQSAVGRQTSLRGDEREFALDAKSNAKRLVKRVARPIVAQLNLRLNPSALDARTADLEADIETLNRYLPTLVNTIASQNASSRENRRLILRLQAGIDNHEQGFKYLQQRIQFIRREILLEQRYHDEDTRQQPEAVEPRVVNETKLEKMRGDLRINLGAGHIPLPDYLNVDRRDLPGIDITSDIRKLPFSPGGIERNIFCSPFGAFSYRRVATNNSAVLGVALGGRRNVRRCCS